MTDREQNESARQTLPDEAVEKLADIEHQRWSHWQRYLHEKGVPQSDGSLLLPADLVAQWTRQFSTTYNDLSEAEKQSDRDQVRRYLPHIIAAIQGSQSNRSSNDAVVNPLRHMQKELEQYFAANRLNVVVHADENTIVLDDQTNTLPPITITCVDHQHFYLKDSHGGFQTQVRTEMPCWNGSEALIAHDAIARIKARFNNLCR